jgi:hypothetical protein
VALSDREFVRMHLVEFHHWPAVARYEASITDLLDIHNLMHDRNRTEEALKRIRQMLNMPDD